MSSTTSGSWLRWTLASAVGYAAGIALWQSIGPALRPLLSPPLGGLLYLAAFGAMLGLSVGLAQALALRQHATQALTWILATAVGSIPGLVSGSWVGLLISQGAPLGTGLMLADVASVLLFGGLLGAAIGAARWFILRRRGLHTFPWVPAGAIALAIGYSAALGLLQLLSPLDVPLLGALFGALTGVFTASLEWLMLRRRPAWTTLFP